MGDFKLRKHSVKAASFIENSEKEKKNDIEIGVEGSILIPKEYDKDRRATVNLVLHLGKKDERLYLTVETISVFEGKEVDVSENVVKAACVPIALANLRKTVKKLTEAYGMPALDLPPFEEESRDIVS